MDPPRQGCAPAVLPAVTQDIRPAAIIYVSCNPAVLADDLPRLRTAGYVIERLQPLDMFPHTEHIETIVTMRRGIT